MDDDDVILDEDDGSVSEEQQRFLLDSFRRSVEDAPIGSSVMFPKSLLEVVVNNLP